MLKITKEIVDDEMFDHETMYTLDIEWETCDMAHIHANRVEKLVDINWQLIYSITKEHMKRGLHLPSPTWFKKHKDVLNKTNGLLVGKTHFNDHGERMSYDDKFKVAAMCMVTCRNMETWGNYISDIIDDYEPGFGNNFPGSILPVGWSYTHWMNWESSNRIRRVIGNALDMDCMAGTIDDITFSGKLARKVNKISDSLLVLWVIDKRNWKDLGDKASLCVKYFPTSYIEVVLSEMAMDFHVKSKMWMTMHNRVPNNEMVRNYVDPTLSGKQVMAVAKALDKRDKEMTWGSLSPHDYSGASKLVKLFGINSLNDKKISFNDGNELPDNDVSDEQAKFIWKWRERLFDAVKISNKWDLLKIELGNEFDSTPFKTKLELAVMTRYVGVDDNTKALARELGTKGYDQGTFDQMHSLWSLLPTINKYESIPAINVALNGYKMYRLDKLDPRQLTMGDHTNCCQKLGGVGESCVFHSVTSDDGCTYVVEKEGQIVAQSWTWRNDKTVVFDNIECVSIESYLNTLIALYNEVSNKMIGKLGIKAVNVGTGYTDFKMPESWKSTKAVETPCLPEYIAAHENEKVYSDANIQMCIAGEVDKIEVNDNLALEI